MGYHDAQHTREEEIRRKLVWECEEILYVKFGRINKNNSPTRAGGT
jgi:hypothetical protein